MSFKAARRSLALVAIVLVPVLAACGSSSGKSQTVVVPNVVGQRMDAAATAIACADLRPYPRRTTPAPGGPLWTKIASQLTSTNPSVVMTDPGAGTAVHRGTTVYLRYLSPPSSFIAIKVTCPR